MFNTLTPYASDAEYVLILQQKNDQLHQEHEAEQTRNFRLKRLIILGLIILLGYFSFGIAKGLHARHQAAATIVKMQYFEAGKEAQQKIDAELLKILENYYRTKIMKPLAVSSVRVE